MVATFEVYEENGEWFWRFLASNGEVLGKSVGYANRMEAENSVDQVQQYAQDAPVKRV